MLKRSLFSSSALIALSFAVTPATAQTSPADAAAPENATAVKPPVSPSLATDQEIIVTGSRLGRQGFDAPTPTIVLSTAQLQQRGSTNVGDFLNEIPAFRPSTSSQSNPQTSGATGQTYADLRALGNIRTLTLVDGKRFVPSATTGQVDLNLIPTTLIDRIDVVTGGVSAVYGSDAISGVVNIILDKRLQGFKGDASAGISTYGDDFERRVSLAAGTSFNEDRGHMLIGGEYVKSDGIGNYTTSRAWGARSDGIVTFPTTRPAGTPSRIFAVGLTTTNAPIGGVVNGSCTTVGCAPAALSTTSPLRGIAFGAGGTVIGYNYGNDTLNTGTAYNFTGDGTPPYLGLQIALPVTRYSTMAHLDYEITPSVSVYLDGNYARSGSHFAAAYPRDQNTTGIVIRRDNAFLPAALAATMDANGVKAVSLARHSIDWDQAHPDNHSTTAQIVAGASGSLFASWKWDGYYEYGQNVYTARIGPIRIEQNYKFAQDAVYYNPTTSVILADASAGIPAGYVAACRALVPGSTTYNPIAAAGCVPINLFGPNAPSAAARTYVNGTVYQQSTTTQQVAALNLRGNLFATWAGPVAVAIGGEWRKESAVQVVDDLSRVKAFNYSNPQPFNGDFSDKEAYGEVLVPLAKDVAFARSLDLSGAARYTDYSISGSVVTWKVGTTWEPVSGLKLRGTASRDIRAPNSSELFQNSQTSTLALNPFTGANASYAVITQPSPNLQPEKSDTRTAGVVFSPRFLPGFNLSVDYYHIKVNGAIATYPNTVVINGCTAEVASPTGPGYFCSFFNRTGTIINSLSLQEVNLASITTSGVDFDMSYRRPLGRGSVIGRVYGTYVAHLTTNDGLGTPVTYNAAGVVQTLGSVIDHAGQVGSFITGTNTGSTDAPHLQLNGSVTYSDPIFSVSATGRYVGGGLYDATLVGPNDPRYNAASPISIDNNHISGRFYLDLGGSFNIIHQGKKTLQIYAVVNNVTNIDPPFPTTQVSGLYDKIGRYFRVGARFAY